jgi:CIC family chloride channel protein
VANANVDAATKPGQLRSGLLRLLKFWVWFSEIAQPNDLQVTLFWAGLIGLFGALTSVGFRWATGAVHTVFTHQSGVSLTESFAHLVTWQRIVIPAIGGLIAGIVISFTKRWSATTTTADYMEAVVLGDGKISARFSLLKSISAMFTIASGGSIGREGPLVQLSSLVASLAGRWRKWSTPRLRLLVGCGAAAGIASAYNAPIAGALFVAEIVLGSMAMEIFGPLVFSSVVATLTTRGLIGGNPLYDIPPFQLNSTWEIIPYLALGLVTGVAAPWFLRLLDASERLFARVAVPVYLKLALGGLVVGLLAAVHPEVCGNGYSSVDAILRGAWLWPTLLSILIFKVLATTATFGSGAVGGVFTPTLFVGASVGYLFGVLWHFLPGQGGLNASALALVGMGAFLAGTTHAPIMAILMIFELTLDYQIILPLMLA